MLPFQQQHYLQVADNKNITLRRTSRLRFKLGVKLEHCDCSGHRNVQGIDIF